MLLQRKRKQLETHVLLYGGQILVPRAEVFHEDPFVAVSAQHVVKNKRLLLHLRPNYIHSASNDIHTDGPRATTRARG